jgi:penicillin-binding protein 1C
MTERAQSPKSKSFLLLFFQKRSAYLVFFLLSLGFVLNRAFPPDIEPYHDASLLVLASDGRPIAALGSRTHFWRLPTDAAAVDPDFTKTLIATEDKSFWWNFGVDPLALLRAAVEDARAGRLVSGGSTITMQVARLLAPHQRTAFGKAVEILRALQLTADYSKPDILSMYLTLAPYGGNIEGVQAASYLYFGHDARRLSRPEISLLVALPRRPAALRPDRHPAAAIQAIARVYAQNGFGPPPEIFAGAISRKPFPETARYLALHLRADQKTSIVRTTIDDALQTEIDQIAAAAPPSAAGADVAILVVRNRDSKILAYAGGNGAPRNSFVDMIEAIRSPGSTLKPFIYGMAFDRDIANPATLIDDTPLANASYDPANFDRSWHGIVPVAVALQQSYNLPAVKMLQELGPRMAVFALRAAGANLVLPAGDTHPSLAIALGGAGINLYDLCSLYAGLTRPGPQSRISPLPGDTAAQAPIMTAASAAQILGILQGLPPPDGTAGFDGRAVAYKTGTSYGCRDAWSIGVSADDTVGVWAGRPDATPRPGAYGLNTAAPIMANVFSLLPPDDGALPPPIIAAAGATPPDAQTAGAAPQIVFPPPNAAIEMDPGDPVALSATGGAPPYRWIIDGVPQAPPAVGEDAAWAPPSPGFYRITAIDARSQVVSETVQVK